MRGFLATRRWRRARLPTLVVSDRADSSFIAKRCSWPVTRCLFILSVHSKRYVWTAATPRSRTHWDATAFPGGDVCELSGSGEFLSRKVVSRSVRPHDLRCVASVARTSRLGGDSEASPRTSPQSLADSHEAGLRSGSSQPSIRATPHPLPGSRQRCRGKCTPATKNSM
jgi:hypothetical protein